MRALVLLALVLATPAHAQSQRGVALIAAEPAPVRLGRGVTLIPEGAKPLAAPPRRPDRLLTVTGQPHAPALTVAKDGAVLSAPVTHAVTGELTAPLQRYGGWMSGVRPLPVGTKFYATQLDGRQVWCAPERAKEGRWAATCFHPGVLGRFIQATVVGDGLFVTRAQMNSTGAIETPAIAAMPHDFGQPMRLVYRFRGWHKHFADLEAFVEHDGGASHLDYVSTRRAADGSALVTVLGSELRLTPAGPKGKDATIEVVRLAETVPASPY